MDMRPSDAEAEEPWRDWARVSVNELVLRAVAGDVELLPLQSLLSHSTQPFPEIWPTRAGGIQVVRSLPAHSSRNETLGWLYNAAVWHLKGPSLARSYLSHWLLPQLLSTPLGGIPRITGITLHWDSAADEWYVSTEGSNFLALYAARNGLAIDRSRCFTTNVLEILSALGLEAVCAVFSNGDLARSLGVNNASCKLLVDHLSSRGAWRGVNRTSIIVNSAVLASITVEDPIKHIRHAAATGTTDNLSGSSANVLTGGPISFGTNGVSLLVDLAQYIR